MVLWLAILFHAEQYHMKCTLVRFWAHCSVWVYDKENNLLLLSQDCLRRQEQCTRVIF